MALPMVVDAGNEACSSFSLLWKSLDAFSGLDHCMLLRWCVCLGLWGHGVSLGLRLSVAWPGADFSLCIAVFFLLGLKLCSGPM